MPTIHGKSVLLFTTTQGTSFIILTSGPLSNAARLYVLGESQLYEPTPAKYFPHHGRISEALEILQGPLTGKLITHMTNGNWWLSLESELGSPNADAITILEPARYTFALVGDNIEVID